MLRYLIPEYICRERKTTGEGLIKVRHGHRRGCFRNQVSTAISILSTKAPLDQESSAINESANAEFFPDVISLLPIQTESCLWIYFSHPESEVTLCELRLSKEDEIYEGSMEWWYWTYLDGFAMRHWLPHPANARLLVQWRTNRCIALSNGWCTIISTQEGWPFLVLNLP